MQIAIVGGGIAGLAFYLALEKNGLTNEHNVIIYESRYIGDASSLSSPESAAQLGDIATVGASLGLGANGLNVLRRLDPDLYREVFVAGHRMTSWKMSNARGWVLADMPTSSEHGDAVMVGRTDLWSALRRRVPDHVVLHKKVVSVNINENGNELVFEDGTTAKADLLVGADGVRSLVRTTLYEGDPIASPKYEGLVGVGGLVPASYLKNVPDAQMNVVFGRNGFFGYGYTNSDPSSPDRHGDRAVWWSTYALAECPVDLRNVDREKAESQLKQRHAEWKNDTIQAIIANVQVTSVWPTLTTPILPYWYRHGAVLVGDAAHALQPTSGQGTSQALEDCESLALLLAFHLANGPAALDLALQQYQTLRMPRVERIHTEADKRAKMKQDMNVVEEMIMYAALWVIGKLGLGQSHHEWLESYDIPAEVKQITLGTSQQL